MTEERSGGCQCGYLRYEVTKRPVGLAVCHCTECQRQSGSAFGLSLGIPEGAFRLTSVTLKTFAVVCDSGRRKTCAFCPECGTRIYHQTVNGMSLKAGTLDDTSWLRPDAHYWTMRKHPWVTIAEGVRKFSDDG